MQLADSGPSSAWENARARCHVSKHIIPSECWPWSHTQSEVMAGSPEKPRVYIFVDCERTGMFNYINSASKIYQIGLKEEGITAFIWSQIPSEPI